MKKLFLSAGVVLTFVLYVLIVRNANTSVTQGVSDVVVSSAPQNFSPLTAVRMPTSTDSPTMMQNMGRYRDGVYTSGVEDAFYGLLQIKVTIASGKISDVQFLQYPNDRSTSREINGQAMPYLKTEAITAQSAHVDIISGATQTSEAFIRTLTSVLAQA